MCLRLRNKRIYLFLSIFPRPYFLHSVDFDNDKVAYTDFNSAASADDDDNDDEDNDDDDDDNDDDLL